MARGGKREGAGRPSGSRAKRRREKSTITIWGECWQYLDAIGPSRGKAVEKLIDFHREWGKKGGR